MFCFTYNIDGKSDSAPGETGPPSFSVEYVGGEDISLRVIKQKEVVGVIGYMSYIPAAFIVLQLIFTVRVPFVWRSHTAQIQSQGLAFQMPLWGRCIWDKRGKPGDLLRLLVLFQQLVEMGPGDMQHFCSLRFVAVALNQSMQNIFPLNKRSFLNDTIVPEKKLDGLRGQPLLKKVTVIDPLKEIFSQQNNIFLPLPKGGDLDGQDVQPEKQGNKENPLLDHLGQVVAGGRNDPNNLRGSAAGSLSEGCGGSQDSARA